MTPSRKRRGRESELILARHMQQHGWPYAEPTSASAQGRDLTGTVGLAIEVKARAKLDLPAWARQARRNAGADIPVVVSRGNGQGAGCVDEWAVVLTLADFLALARDAGYGDGVVTTTARINPGDATVALHD